MELEEFYWIASIVGVVIAVFGLIVRSKRKQSKTNQKIKIKGSNNKVSQTSNTEQNENNEN